MVRSLTLQETPWPRAASGSQATFGDDNLIDGLTIRQDTFDTSGSAIQVFAADHGNSNNRFNGLEITDNVTIA